MNRFLCGLVVLCLLGLPASGTADIIFNNFGPGDTFFLYGGRTLANDPTNPILSQRLMILGCAFTPTGSYYFDSVKLAAFTFGPYPALDVLLMSDQNGLPGTIIESMHIADATGGVSGALPTKPVVASSTLSPILDANTQYWIVASLPTPEPPGYPLALGWWAPPIENDRGPEAEMYGGTGWQLGDDQYRFAFSVSGTPVPEPSTLLLLASGTLGLIGWAWRWRGKRRKATWGSRLT